MFLRCEIAQGDQIGPNITILAIFKRPKLFFVYGGGDKQPKNGVILGYLFLE